MTLYLVRRETKKGVRWHVRFEHKLVDGGRIVHLGVFDTEKRAKRRIEAAKDEIAEGKVPTRFAAVFVAPKSDVTVASAAEAWFATLTDLRDNTLTGYALIVRSVPAWLASMNPSEVMHSDLAGFAGELSRRYKRGTAAKHLGVLRMILDHSEGRPNPEHHMRIRMARSPRKIYRLPTRVEIAKLHSVMPSRAPLMLFLEHTGLRIHEATNLRWSDFDRKRDRFLVSESKTPSGRRWVERLPGAPAFPVHEGQHVDARVFVHPTPSSLTGMLRASHLRHGTFLMSAHEFRHLHASRLLHDRILSPAEISARLGHASPALTLDVYVHVAPPD